MEIPHTISPQELQTVLKQLYREYDLSLPVVPEEPPESILSSGGIVIPEYKGPDFPRVTMEDFVVWVRGENKLAENADQYVAHLAIRPEAMKAIQAIFAASDFVVAGVLFPLWPSLVMQHIPPARNSVQLCDVAVTIGFYDGRVVQLRGSAQFPPAQPITDGFLCSFVAEQATSLTNTLAAYGIDRMYTEYSKDVHRTEEEAEKDRKPIQPPPPGRMGFG